MIRTLGCLPALIRPPFRCSTVPLQARTRNGTTTATLRVIYPATNLGPGRATQHRPQQVAERLQPAIGVDYVHPIAYFESTDHSQDLVRGQVEGVQGQSQLFMLHERKTFPPQGPVPASASVPARKAITPPCPYKVNQGIAVT